MDPASLSPLLRKSLDRYLSRFHRHPCVSPAELDRLTEELMGQTWLALETSSGLPPRQVLRRVFYQRFEKRWRNQLLGGGWLEQVAAQDQGGTADAALLAEGQRMIEGLGPRHGLEHASLALGMSRRGARLHLTGLYRQLSADHCWRNLMRRMARLSCHLTTEGPQPWVLRDLRQIARLMRMLEVPREVAAAWAPLSRLLGSASHSQRRV